MPAAVRAAVEVMKRHHEPFPLVVIDRAYRVLDANAGAAALLGTAAPGLAALDGFNLARFTFDPDGGGAGDRQPRRGRARAAVADAARAARRPGQRPAARPARREVLASDGLDPDWRRPDLTTPSAPTLELRLRVGDQVWTFLVLVTAILAPQEVALDELRIESWFPADDVTASGCAALARGSG